MKNNNFPSHLSARLLCIIALTLFSELAMCQGFGVTVTLLRQPCSNDGILVVHDTVTTTFPVTFQYNSYNGAITNHVSNTAYDTLYNYSGEALNIFTSSLTGSARNYYYIGSPPFTYTDTVIDAHCPIPGSVSFIITGGTAPYSFQWINVSNNILVANGNPVALSAGTYYANITDANGCTVNHAGTTFIGGLGNFPGIRIQNNSPIIPMLTTTVANCTNGTVKIASITGGITPYTYAWNNGANTDSITGLSAGQYNVTIIDAQGCFKNLSVQVTQAVNITVLTTVTDATCLQNDGGIVLFGSGGVSPYSYQWGNGQQVGTLTNLSSGTYSVTINDANNCTATTYGTVGVNTPINVTYTATSSLCVAPTGTASLTITGGTSPYNVTWQTFPVQTGTTATNLSPGDYRFSVTDASGCIRTGTSHVPPTSIIAANVYKSDATCNQPTGLVDIITTSGTHPFVYQWNNGATTNSISNLSAGNYWCKITDSLGCSVTKNAYVYATSPIAIGFSTIPVSCIFRSDGSATATAVGGTPPYTYNWGNGQTVSTATGLPTGYHYVYVTDANGCTQTEMTYVGYNASNDSCYCTLTGRVFVDTNANCILDNGEIAVHNIMVHCTNAGYSFTNSTGYYSFKVPFGSYTLSENVQAYYPLANCQNNAVQVISNANSGCVISHDFANVINPIHDINITVANVNQPIPGNNYLQRLVVQNNGTSTENDIQLGYKHYGQLTLNAIVPNTFIQTDPLSFPNSYNVVNSFPSLAPTDYSVYDISYSVPTNIPLGTGLVFEDTSGYISPIASWLNDYSPWNNVNKLRATVVGSFDPNEKSVLPQGLTSHGYINNQDSILNYTLHFQNTGTYPAQKVVVIDTLSKYLDISTIKLGYSNHAYTAALSDSGVLTFTFDNILLPDSNTSPIASIGMVMYSIHLKPNLPFGTEVKSPANIYFDYNAPVKTNIALNTIGIGDTTSVLNINMDKPKFSLYPNPSNGQITVLINSSQTCLNANLIIYNPLGKIVKSQTFNLQLGVNTIYLNAIDLTSGLYFVEIRDGINTMLQKMIISN